MNRLHDLSKGHEISVLPLSEVLHKNEKLRIDSGYFMKAAIAAERRLEEMPNVRLGDLAGVFRKGIFDIKADTYVESGQGIPFIRISDIKTGILQKASTAWIDSAAHKLEAKTALKSGDLVLSKTGYPAAALVNVPECNVSQDTIAVKLTAAARRDYQPGFLAAYLNSQQGLALMARRFQGNVQQHLSLEDGKSILVPAADIELQSAVHQLVLDADKQQDVVAGLMKTAENHLLKALNLDRWNPVQPLSYTGRALHAWAAGRIDAQYFRPVFAALEERLRDTGTAVELGSILHVNTRGRQPEYADEGLPVINSKHVRINRVVLEDNRRALDEEGATMIGEGDVLINGTGVGTIGRTAPYLHKQPALPDNHVTVLRTDVVDPVYLSVFLNSRLGQLQVERHTKGSSGQIELYPNDIERIVVWVAPGEVQQAIREDVLSAFREERRGSDLMQTAIRAVELFLSQGERSALAYINAAKGAL